MSAPNDLHQLLDAIPAAEWSVARRFLAFLCTQTTSASPTDWDQWFTALPAEQQLLLEQTAQRARQYGLDFEQDAKDRSDGVASK